MVNLIVSIVLSLFTMGMAQAADEVRYKQAHTCINDYCYQAEIADDDMSRAVGLQKYNELKERHAMLFVFQGDAQHTFWMKQMKFNIDIMWLNDKGRIVHIEEYVPACKESRCPVYTSPLMSRYVLEVPEGDTARYGFMRGDKVDIRYLEEVDE